MLTGRLSGGSVVMSRPRSSIRPAVGSSKPPIIRRVVVLPQPLGPSIEKNSPDRMSIETRSTARTSRKCLVRSVRRISGVRRRATRSIIRASLGGDFGNAVGNVPDRATRVVASSDRSPHPHGTGLVQRIGDRGPGRC